MSDPRTSFARTATALLDEDPRVALVYAEISGQHLRAARRAHAERVVNVGIREQLLVNVGAGMALTGLRPVVHTFASFLVERAFEQVKLGFGHQGVGGVLVGSAGSFDVSAGGRTHQAPGDVALLDTLPGWTVHVPGHADEVVASLRLAVADDPTSRHYLRVVAQQNSASRPVTPGRFEVVRRGSGAVVIAVGPMLDAVSAATSGRDVTVLYANVVRPFDAATLREVLLDGPASGPRGRDAAEVVLVEPYLAGTSSRLVADALVDVPHRLLALGVGDAELRRYGTPEEHLAAHGLDAAGIRASVDRFTAMAVGRVGT